MTTKPVVSVTDELAAELETAALKASGMQLDSAEEVIEADASAMIECPVCGGEGYASLENDYCNFDNHAIGVQFYGIGSEFGAAERYFRAASPSTILALLAERAELKRDAERFEWLLAERCIMRVQNGTSSPAVYSLWWSNLGCGQIEWLSSPREAIDAAIAAQQQGGEA
jgi:hypothetical protein